MSTSLNWRIPSDADLRGRRWPGELEYVFYHGATGDTHRLSELAGLVIELILEGKGQQSFLIQWLRDQGDETPESTLKDLLDGLARLDLVEPEHAAR